MWKVVWRVYPNSKSQKRYVIESEKLTAENAFYWSWVCKKINSLLKLKSNQSNEKKYDYLDRLLPSLTEYCDYIIK